MGEERQKPMKQQICAGILAHVDAGKTTLSEGILYLTGAIRKLGRVDHKTTFLDTDHIEQNRGITIFSKEARFTLEGPAGTKPLEVTLLDTPGHADFSGEMERTLRVLDYAVLVISGADGVQSHTVTLWKLLKAYEIPTFVFINKMDQPGTDKEALLKSLSEVLGDGFVEFDGSTCHPTEEGFEAIAMCSESLMEEYLETGCVKRETIRDAIAQRKVFPVSFGSALKLEGVKEFLDVMAVNMKAPKYPEPFGAKVYKITRDKNGARQTHMKITGGCLKAKTVVEPWEEKVDQIRLYAGTGFSMVQEAPAGTVCVVTGLTKTKAGDGLGYEAGSEVLPMLEPALTYQVILPEGVDPVIALQKLRQLEEEDPLLRLVWKEPLKEIHVQVMGELELEILAGLIQRRFDMEVTFGEGSLIYKETLSKPVIGIGHFEPLRHYAEVHLLLEPGEPGSGMVFDSICSGDKLDRNWQRLITTHLKERKHPGVLTGSEITDLRIRILAGRAHLKHTEGGDFRQATYRAIRHGIRKAMAEGNTILLEPVYRFRLELPAENLGRAMADMQRFGAECTMETDGSTGVAVLTGWGPVATLREYQRDVTAYTKGQGRFLASMAGYGPCHNQEEVIASRGYFPEQDLENPTGSVFCTHGAADFVHWFDVDERAHVDSGYYVDEEGNFLKKGQRNQNQRKDKGDKGLGGISATEKELEEIFLRTYGKSKRDEALRREHMSKGSRRPQMPDLGSLHRKLDSGAPSYLIVDGYNVIFAWEELKELAKVNLDGAREAFLELLANYQGYRKCGILVVFDGYKVKGNPGTQMKMGNLEVVFTKEAETADRFIEKTIFELGRQYKITVITSDRPVQMAAIGDGAYRMSAREFYQDVMSTSEEIRKTLSAQTKEKFRPFEGKL